MASASAGRRERRREYRLGGRWVLSTGGAAVRSSRRTTPKEKTSDAGVYSPEDLRSTERKSQGNRVEPFDDHH
jgi:hypothetical protein